MDNHVNDTVGGAHMYNGYNVQFVKDRFGNPNSAMRFSDGYYQVPPGVYFNGDLTISVWIKTINTFNYSESIIDFANGSPLDNVIFAASYGYSGQPGFYIFIKHFETNTEPGLPFVLGQWTHMVFTLCDTVGYLYMNGLLISQANYMIAPRNVNRASNYVGKSNLDGQGNLWADLDELRFYNRSMTQAEVNYLFLQQASAQTSSLNRYLDFSN